MAERKCRVTIDGEVREYAAGTTYQAIAAEFQHRYPHRIVLVFVDQFHLQELRKTVLLVTHDPQIASYADRIIFLKDGVILDELKKGESQEAFYRETLERMADL